MALIGIFRQSSVPVFDSLWAEDALFISESAGPFEAYRGYFHVVPRSLAWAVAHLPADAWPWAVSLTQAVVVSSVAIFVYHSMKEVVADHRLRLLLSVWLVVPPVAAPVTSSLANLHWFFLIGAFFACFAPRTKHLERWGLAIMSAAVLSNPLAGIIGFIAALNKRWKLAAVGAIGTLLLLVVDPTGEMGMSWGAISTGLVLWVRASIAAVGGDRLSMSVVETVPALSGLFAVPIAVAARRVLRCNQAFVVSGLAVSIFVALVAPIGRGTPGDVTWAFGNLRFALIPAFLMLTIMAAALTHQRLKQAFAGLMIVVLAAGFGLDHRSTGPVWSEALVSAQCVDESRLVPVAPGGHWHAVVECS